MIVRAGHAHPLVEGFYLRTLTWMRDIAENPYAGRWTASGDPHAVDHKRWAEARSSMPVMPDQVRDLAPFVYDDANGPGAQIAVYAQLWQQGANRSGPFAGAQWVIGTDRIGFEAMTPTQVVQEARARFIRASRTCALQAQCRAAEEHARAVRLAAHADAIEAAGTLPTDNGAARDFMLRHFANVG